MTQNEMVLGWIKKAPIGPMVAMKELGVMRLAARIKDLRDDGHKIQTEWDYVIDRYGEERRVARYILKELANGTSAKGETEVGQGGQAEEKPPSLEKSCHYCGVTLLRKPSEKTSDWRVRKFCNRSCATSHKNTLYVSTHEMLMSRSVKVGDCLEWQGYLDKKGYGRCGPVNGEVLTHRVSYQEFVGPIPDGLHVLHSCDNARCINPEHLRAGTNDDNVADRHERGRWASMKGRRNPNWKHGKYTNPDWSFENA